MFDIIKQLNCKSTAIRYIDSCETNKHINTMEKYIELYFEKYEDLLGKSQLMNMLISKRQTIKTTDNGINKQSI